MAEAKQRRKQANWEKLRAKGLGTSADRKTMKVAICAVIAGVDDAFEKGRLVGGVVAKFFPEFTLRFSHKSELCVMRNADRMTDKQLTRFVTRALFLARMYILEGVNEWHKLEQYLPNKYLISTSFLHGAAETTDVSLGCWCRDEEWSAMD